MVVELFRPLPIDAKVETLIDADSEWWSSHPIDHTFLSFEAQRIKASISVQPRKTIFYFGRRLAMGLILSSRVINFFVRIVKETLLRCQTLKLFKNSGVGIWKLKVPGEFKHFVCKVCSKALLTKVFYIHNNPA